MNSSAEKILYRKAALIFEELGFLMPRSDNGEIFPGDSTNAIVSFRGPFSGCLIVSLNPEMLSILSSNMLGEEGRADTSMEHDSLGEIANVICGNALPAIYGFEPVFHLDAPQPLADATALLNDSGFKKEAEVHISFDTGHAAVTLLIKNNATQKPPV
jgi:CheY-specific phosphatase CheX